MPKGYELRDWLVQHTFQVPAPVDRCGIYPLQPIPWPDFYPVLGCGEKTSRWPPTGLQYFWCIPSMTKVLLGFLMSMYGQLPDEVARYNAYLTLHMEGVYGAKVSCEPFSEDPNNPYLYRCTVNNDEAYIRLYCESNEAGPFLCRNHFIIPKK